MTRPGASDRDVALLAAATMGVYVLLMAGATAAITDAASACSTWPTCDGRWLVPLDDLRLAVAWGHRVIALLVGALVLAAVVRTARATERRRVRLALVLPLALFPVQIGLGALVVTDGGSTVVSALHLAAGVAIFSGLLLALAWTLEGRAAGVTGSPEPTVGNPEAAKAGPERDPPPAPASDTSTGPGPASDGLRGTVCAYLSLTKPRLMWLLCLVAAAGMGLAAGPALSARTAAATLIGGVLAIGASGTFNHVFERDVDRRMQRTADRPLATDRVGVRNAVAFGIVLAVASIAVFLSINVLAATLGLVAILYYSVVYTLILKPHTVQNTVVGGFAGSLPALIGAAAATGTVGPGAWLLAALIFLWTPAHFYNLALAYREDYARGGFPMLPVVRGERVARKHVLWYLGATLVAAALLSAAGGLGPLYALTAVTLGTVFLWAVIRLHAERTAAAAMRSFHASNAFLGALLLAVILDTLAL